MISQSTIERVREIPVYDVVSHFVELKKAGANFQGKSPWNNEKTPSLYVVPSKNIFKDFSSGKGGDAIRFVMDHERVDFVEAVQIICQKANVPFELESSDFDRMAEIGDREMQYKLLQDASVQYSEQIKILHSDHPAYIELTKRAFTTDTLIQWQIGFAPGQTDAGYKPDQWKFITSKLHERGLIDTGVKVGLVAAKNETHYDTFRNRLIFPIHNHDGRIVGFGGRALHVNEFNAKYINSPESAVYKKDTVLFGLNFADHAIRQSRYAFLMEGYTDVISFHQAGLHVAVGTCGTSFTPGQAKLLKRHCDKVVIFPDPDEAGIKSASRTVNILLQTGLQTAVVTMPNVEGKKIDPDEFTRLFSHNHIPNDTLQTK